MQAKDTIAIFTWSEDKTYVHIVIFNRKEILHGIKSPLPLWHTTVTKNIWENQTIINVMIKAATAEIIENAKQNRNNNKK